MQLSDFRDLIANMPVPYQGFSSKRSTWASHINSSNKAGEALNSIFGTSEEVTISRCDLQKLASAGLEQFVMATIIWGYSSGMRGKNFANIISHLEPLTELLSAARLQPVENWHTHFAKIGPIVGLGLSTHTKFLSFLQVEVQGYTALILDDRIIQVASRGIFKELSPIQRLSSYNADRMYPQYLKCMHDVANDLAVPAENLEFFLFEFGLSLKPLTNWK